MACRPPGRRTYAFTLVELLVVLAILLILAGILIPVIGRVRFQAQQVRCAGQLRQIGMAFNAYRNEYHVFPKVSGPQALIYPHVIAGTTTPLLADTLKDLVDGVNAIFYCPANAQYRTPATHWPSLPNAHYSMTYQVTFWPSTSSVFVPPVKPDRVDANTLVAADFYATKDSARATNVVWNHDTGNGVGGMNELFGDGRVEWHPASEKWTCWMQDTANRFYWWMLGWP